MNILYIHQYFFTPEEGGCTRSYELAKGLVMHGHEVILITAHNQKSGIHEIDGIKVHYLPIKYKNAFGFIRRIYAFLKFVYLAKKTAAKMEKIDLAYVMTTPLTTGLIALHLKEKKNIPFYFEVGDLWPAAPIQMGVIKNRFLITQLQKFERKCYFEATKVIALSPAIRNYIETISPQTKVHILPNLADCDFFRPADKTRKLEPNKLFNVGYFGTFGKANDLEKMVSVAKECKELPVAFHLMGEGAEEKHLRTISKGLTNIFFYTFGNKRQVKSLMERMDAVYISFKNVEILNTGSPNKFFDGLAAGKLILLNFGGWIRSVVEEHKCGFYHDPQHPVEFCRKIQPFLKNPTLLKTYQKNSRLVAKKYYDKPLAIEKLIKILNNEKRLSVRDSEVYILTA